MRRPGSARGSYRAIEWHGYRGWYDHDSAAASLLASIDDPAAFANAGTTARDERRARNAVTQKTVDGHVLWVKWFRPRSGLSWLRYVGRDTKAVKAWNIAFDLLEAGVNTPRPLAGLERNGIRSRLFGLMIFEDFHDARHFAQALHHAGERRGELLAGAARFLAAFHASGYRHRDLQGANLLVRERATGHDFCLVDVNRARFHGRLRSGQCLRDLERLPLGDDDLDTFFDAYMTGDGAAAAAQYRRRMRQRARLQKLPWPTNRIARRLWYYWRELTT